MNDDMRRGFLVCLTEVVYMLGVTPETEDLFEMVGSPSAKEVRRLGLDQYDRDAINKIRKAMK